MHPGSLMLDVSDLPRLTVHDAYAGGDWRLAAILARGGEYQVIAALLDKNGVFNGLAAWNNRAISKIDFSLLEGATLSYAAATFPLSLVVDYAEKYVKRLLADSTMTGIIAVAKAEINLWEAEVPRPEKFGHHYAVAEVIAELFFRAQLLGGPKLMPELRARQITIAESWEARGLPVRALSGLDEAIQLCEQLHPVMPEYLEAQRNAVKLLILLHLWPVGTEDLRG